MNKVLLERYLSQLAEEEFQLGSIVWDLKPMKAELDMLTKRRDALREGLAGMPGGAEALAEFDAKRATA